jgi:hypothetical protein
MNDCEGCFVVKNNCFILQLNQKEICPCRICLVKILCKSMFDICNEYERVLEHCHTIKDDMIDE